MWSSPYSWQNNYLNSHTNLTEISNAIDLMWRSNVSPSKVVLGLAFYSRTFTASSTECVSKGCRYDSAGDVSTCSGEVGVLSNAEVHQLMARLGGVPTLDEEAAVQVFSHEDQWITYEDDKTLKIKADFVRSRCMGGVMVWSVNRDTKDGTYSKALETAIGKVQPPVEKQGQSQSSNATMEAQESDGSGLITNDVPREQCRWTNCDEGCPAGWQLVQRRDIYKENRVEYMFDDSSCNGQGSRKFCCPPGPAPACQWLFHNGGKCNPDCSDYGVQVASTNIACNNGLTQLACCSVQETYYKGSPIVESMQIWDKCRWHGKEPDCAYEGTAEDACASEENNRTLPLISTYLGSGSTTCKLSTGSFPWSWKRTPQAFCCEAPYPDRSWDGCFWNGMGEDGSCEASCPSGYLKVALDDDPDYCKSGSRAYCCRANIKTKAHSDEEASQYLREIMQGWTEEPVCPVQRNNFKRGTQTTSENPTSVINARQRKWRESEPAMMENVAAWIMAHDEDGDPTALAWDDIVAAKYTYVTVDKIQAVFRMSKKVKDIVSVYPEAAADALTCQIDNWERFFREGSATRRIACPPDALYEALPEAHQEDADIDLDARDTIPQNYTREPRTPSHLAARGTGSGRNFNMVLKDGEEASIFSLTYPNGENGQVLARRNNDNRRFTLEFDPFDCAITRLVNNGSMQVAVQCKIQPSETGKLSMRRS